MESKGNSMLSESERQRLRAAREDKGLSRQALSRLMFYSCATITAVENGLKNPSIDFLKRYCQSVGLDINGLFDVEN